MMTVCGMTYEEILDLKMERDKARASNKQLADRVVELMLEIETLRKEKPINYTDRVNSLTFQNYTGVVCQKIERTGPIEVVYVGAGPDLETAQAAFDVSTGHSRIAGYEFRIE